MLCELREAKKSFRQNCSKSRQARAKLNPKGVVIVLTGAAILAGASQASAKVPLSETPSSAISGVVLSQTSNKPVANVIVSVRSESEGISRSVLTDYAGQFEVDGIPDGKYVVSIEEPGYEPLTVNEQLSGPPLKLSLHLIVSKFIPRERLANTVSVHELKIPYKAAQEFRKGLEHLNKNDLQQSLNHFAKATHVFADFYEAFYHLGVVQLRLGDRDRAMESFQHAINLSGGSYASAQFGMGYVLFLDGQLSEAEKVLRRGLEIDANPPDGHAILAMVLLKLNRLDEAEKSAREALVRNPNFAGAYLVLSDVYGRRRDYRQQLTGLDSFLKLQPSGPLSERAHHARDLTLAMLAKSQPQN